MALRLKNNFKGEAGERIPHDYLNTLANFWNDFQVLGGSLTKRGDGRFTTISLSSASLSDCYPFHVFISTDPTSSSKQSIVVRCGSWRRMAETSVEATMETNNDLSDNSLVAPIAFSSDPATRGMYHRSATVFTSTGTWYAAIRLDRAATAGTPLESRGDRIRVNFTKDFSTWVGTSTPEAPAVAPQDDIWNSYKVVAQLTVATVNGAYVVSDVVQLWRGGNIKERWMLTDTEGSALVNTGSAIQTIEPGPAERADQIQLRNVDQLPELCFGIPYFRSVAANSGKVVGELNWLRPDGAALLDRGTLGLLPTYSSLTVRDRTTTTDGIMEVHGFQAAGLYKAAYKVCAKASPTTTDPATISWQYPVATLTAFGALDAHYGAGAGGTGAWSSTIVDDVWGTGNPAPPASGTPYGTVTRIRRDYDIDRATLIVEEAATLSTFYVAVTMNGWIPGKNDVFHNRLAWSATTDFQNAYGASCSDHDPRHWVKGAGYAANYGTSIGLDSSTKLVDLSNKQLTLGTDIRLDWANHRLVASSSNRLDWANYQLLIGADTSLDWYNWTLCVAGTTTLDWKNRRLRNGDWRMYDTGDFGTDVGDFEVKAGGSRGLKWVTSLGDASPLMRIYGVDSGGPPASHEIRFSSGIGDIFKCNGDGELTIVSILSIASTAPIADGTNTGVPYSITTKSGIITAASFQGSGVTGTYASPTQIVVKNGIVTSVT